MNRRFYTLFLAALSLSGLMAQVPAQGQASLPYFLPQTVVDVVVSWQSTVSTPGPYAKYAERYLGVTDAIQHAATACTVKSVSVQTHGEADRSVCYQAPVSGLASHVSLNKQGVIKGVNLPLSSASAATSASAAAGKSDKPCPAVKSQKAVRLSAPLSEQVMLASGDAKVAESAATQIYKLRESRMNLLCGDWSDLPADGKSTALLLDEMKRTEQQLTELFTGSTRQHTESVTLSFVPTSLDTTFVLFRFSGEQGVVGADDLAGSPYQLHVTVTPLSTQKADFELKPALYYRMPATAAVQVLDMMGNVVAVASCPISQFGRLLVVPAGAYKSGESIRWDATTGALRHVGQTGLGQ